MIRRDLIISGIGKDVAVNVWNARFQQLRRGLLLHVLFLAVTTDAKIVLRNAECSLALTVGTNRGVLRLDSVIPLKSRKKFNLDLALDVAPLIP